MSDQHTPSLFFASNKHDGKLTARRSPGILAVDLANTGIAHPEHESNTVKIADKFVFFCEHLLLCVGTKRKSRSTMEGRAEKLLREMHTNSGKVFVRVVQQAGCMGWNGENTGKQNWRRIKSKQKHCSSMSGERLSKADQLMF